MANTKHYSYDIIPLVGLTDPFSICVAINNNLSADRTPFRIKSRTHYSRMLRENRASIGMVIAMLRTAADKHEAEHVTGQLLYDTGEYLWRIQRDLSVRRVERTEPAVLRIDGSWHGAVDSERWVHVEVVENYMHTEHPDTLYESYSRSQLLHNLHVSLHDANLIAYYPTLKHYREGREVRTRLGAYLTKYADSFGLDQTTIKTLVDRYNAVLRGRTGWRVEFIEHDDEQGWVDVYDSSKVSSCMQGETAVRVYAHEHSELRLAYVKDSNDDVIARCIVRDDPNGDRTGWLRVYPEPSNAAEGRFLLDYLTANGYANRTHLNGALLQCIPSRYSNAYVCPYLDYGSGGDQTVSFVYKHGKEFLECGGGDISAANTNGYTEEQGQECDCCGERFSEDDMTYVESTEQTVCENCLGSNFTYAYGRSSYQEYFPEDDCIRCLSDREWYVRDHADRHDVYQCEYTDEWYHIDDMVSTSRGYVHVDEVQALDHEDSDGNHYAVCVDAHQLSDGTWCHDDDAYRLQEELDAETNVSASGDAN